MGSVPLSLFLALVVRRERARAAGLDEAALCTLLEFDEPFGSNDALISLGPIFDEECASEMRRRLVEVGLEDVDDFFVLMVDIPEWMALRAEAADAA